MGISRFIIGSSLFVSTLFAGANLSEEEFFQKITSSLLIKDYRGAEDICQTAKQIFPASHFLQTLMIRILAESGQSDAALQFFKESTVSKDVRDSFFLIESLSWGILLHSNARSETSAISSLVGAYMTQDARASSLLLEALDSSNALLRIYAAKFAAQYNDRMLQKKLLFLLKEEKNWYVKREVVSAVGRMKLLEAAPLLKEMIASRGRSQEEKGWAMESLIQIYETVNAEEIGFLLEQNRSGLRELGVRLIDHFERVDMVPKILPLLRDSSPSVRISTMCALGTLDVDPDVYTKIEKEITSLTDDMHPDVAIIASWLLLKFNQEKGRASLEKWVLSEDIQAARFASSVMSAGGRFTASLVAEIFQEVKDPFVKANLAIGMIKQNSNLFMASEYMKNFLLTHKEKIMWREGPLPMFQTLSPSMVKHVYHIAQYPLLVDQLTKLDLVNMLLAVGVADAKTLIRQFLKEKAWGIVGSASVALLEEGDLEAIEVIRELLKDEEENIRIQAALALAFYGHDPSVVKVLQDAYDVVPWEKKMSILEALGFIGSRDSIFFLLKVMEEPFGLLRTIAASSVIQCLYH